jgi:carbon storage regulator
MLVLTRKTGETIKIGEDIEITVLSTKGDQIKIGIKAPKQIEIYRKELIEQITDENVLASTVKFDLLNLLKNNI